MPIILNLPHRLLKARSSLTRDHPFVGSIALGLPFEENSSIPTACTDGKSVQFNPGFCSALPDEELLFLVAHECMHIMLGHHIRRGNRDQFTWNRAADYVINKLLVDEMIGRMPICCLHCEQLFCEGGGTAEGIYAVLSRDTQSHQSGIGSDSMPSPANVNSWQGEDECNVRIGDVTFKSADPLDECRDFPGSEAEMAQEAAELKIRVAQAAEAAKKCGKQSTGIGRVVQEILHPKVEWREVLRRFMVKCRSEDRSWSRPNRRYLAQGLYLPGSTGEALGEIAIAIDCSGSIGSAELDQFAAEIAQIKEEHRPTCIHLLYFDSEVVHYEKIVRDDEFAIAPHGGGGTAFSPVFEFMAEQSIDPVACVLLTDLCCDDFGPQPAYPVLWVATERGDAPFGEIILM